MSPCHTIARRGDAPIAIPPPLERATQILYLVRMLISIRSALSGPGLFLAAALAGCGVGEESTAESAGASPLATAASFRYNREYIFIAPRADPLLVVPFTFRSRDDGTQLQRGVRGWVGRGATWERFLDDSWETSQAGGVWRVVPQGDLRIDAGGLAEVETLRFQRGERRLRLDLQAPLTGWNQGGDTRFRLISGRLSIGSENLVGPIIEVLRVEQTLEDGWPPGQDFDAIFLTSGDSIQLVLAERIGGDAVAAASAGQPGYAWTRRSSSERTWDGAEIRWGDMRPYQEARRDVPRAWYFQIPGAGIYGEVEAEGFDAVLGPERAGRRAVEIRFGVTGWVELQGERREVVGMVRHTQQ